MKHDIYIITRQMFYTSRGARYAIDDNNPVIAAYQTLAHAIELVERLADKHDPSEFDAEVINHHSSVGLMFTYVCKNSLGQIEREYNIIHETVLI